VLQALAVEALNDLPAKHGKRPNVKNPLLDHREQPHLPASESPHSHRPGMIEERAECVSVKDAKPS
jgi:hypothetical protein